MADKHNHHHDHCGCEHNEEKPEMRSFKALYLLPYGYGPSADNKYIVDPRHNKVAKVESISADMVIGLGALQPINIVAQLADSTYSFVDVDEVDLQTSNGQEVGFYFEPDYDWSGVEGREFTKNPVLVTVTWLGDSSLKAQAAITVAPVKELLWLPAFCGISADGRYFVDENDRKLQDVPQSATLEVGKKYPLQAVAKYADDRYRVMSRTELEFVVLEDEVSVDYDADADLYWATMKATPAAPVEIMLVSLASEDLLGSFFLDCSARLNK